MHENANSPKLKQGIGLPQAIALYIGSVLGSGVLIVPGLAAELAGPASLLAWGFMVLLILPMALSMGLLSAKYPNAGGVSHFVTLAYGKRAGTLVGWFFLMSVPIGAPVAALTGAGYLTAALGWGEGAKIAMAAVMLAAALFTNWIGMQLAGKIQIAVVIAIAAVLVFPLRRQCRGWRAPTLLRFCRTAGLASVKRLPCCSGVLSAGRPCRICPKSLRIRKKRRSKV